MTPADDASDARALREELIVGHAQRLLLSEGFLGLNLDTVAKAADCAKGTIYLHFASKEDLALAVVTQALKRRSDMFERALQFQGRSRERARAIGFACCQFAVEQPDFSHVELMLKSHSFRGKASPERKHAHGMQGGRCFRAVHSVVVDGRVEGDLPKGNMTTEHMAFAMVAITMGSYIMSQLSDLCLLAGVMDPLAVVRRNQDALLDGFGWKPLLCEWDYAATDRRIRETIFPEATWLK